MFVGHYAVAFAIRNERNQIPLWVLFVAVQLLDFLWAPFVLFGIEKVRIVPGLMAASPLDLYYTPYTHSLLGALVWSALAFAAYRVSSGATGLRAGSLLVGVAVFSHWILDLLVHRPDLAIYDNTLKVGLGLWNYKGLEFGLEIAILIGGIVLYLKRNTIQSVAKKSGIIIFGLMLILTQAVNTFAGPRLFSSGRVVAIMALISYTVFAVVAFILGNPRAGQNPQRI